MYNHNTIPAEKYGNSQGAVESNNEPIVPDGSMMTYSPCGSICRLEKSLHMRGALSCSIGLPLLRSDSTVTMCQRRITSVSIGMEQLTRLLWKNISP